MASSRIKLAPVHPGEILREDFIKPLGLSVTALARELRVPPNRLAEIVMRSGESAGLRLSG
jgi:antitoxin HigA-1